MIRVVVTVLLALVLVAASLPAIDYAAAERSETEVRAGIDDLDRAATELARSEEAVPGTVGARRVVTVELPAERPTAAEVDHLTVAPDGRTYRFRVAGRAEHAVRGTVPVYTHDGRPLELREAGRHRLVLALVSVEGSRRVVVARQRTASELGLV